MSQTTEVNNGEILISFKTPTTGKQTFKDLGLKESELSFESGFLRLVFDLEGIGEHSYFAVPTIEVAYAETMSETHWQCEFNGTVILDKMDHYGRSTVLLLDRKKISELEHHHQNKLIIHAEFPQGVHILAEDSYINLFK